ncbi:MAG: hypothetical protein V2J24_08850, partial [Pseudomonadales bacterium]|nr:hypothetical protein [Pseudomonadales bacterium]
PLLLRLGPDLVPDVIAGLEAGDIVCRDADDDWLPARSFDRVTVDDVVRALPGYWLEELSVDVRSDWHARLAERVRQVQRAREEALALSLSELFAGEDTRTEEGSHDRISNLSTAEQGRRNARG